MISYSQQPEQLGRSVEARRKRNEVSNESLCALAQAGDTSARDRLIDQNMGVIVMLAGKMANGNHSIDDLVQEGVISFMRLIPKYDPSRGASFGTFMHMALTHRIVRIAQVGGVVHCPRIIKQKNTPSIIEDKRRAMAATNLDYSSCVKLKARDDKTAAILEESAERDSFYKALDELCDRERFILLGTAEGKTLEAMGVELGLTKERVRQIKVKAIERIQGLLKVGRSKLVA